jgi:hypothetical protein
VIKSDVESIPVSVSISLIMKKTLLLAALFFLFYQSQAQINNVKFGLKAGASLATMNFNKGVPPPPATISNSWKPGFVAGLWMRVPILEQLSVQPEYLYTYVPGKNSATNNQYTMSYVSLPVVFNYQILPKLSLQAGPQFDLLIKATGDVNGTRVNITHDTEERSIFAVAGLEFAPISFLSINARYLHGFNHIGIGQRSAVTEFKYQIAQLSAAISF